MNMHQNASALAVGTGPGRRKARVTFINTHPIQYFAPLYASLSRAQDMDVGAIYLSDYSIRGGVTDAAFGRVVKWDVDLVSGYTVRFARHASSRGEPRSFWSMVGPELWSEIGRRDVDAIVVHGHSPAAMLVGVAAAMRNRIPVFMRGETHLGLQRSALKAALRRPLLSTLYRSLSGVLAIGTANAQFYRAMGVPEERIFYMPYTVDNDRFMAASRIDARERAELRSVLGAKGDEPVLLYAAKFQDRKRPQDLIAAARILADRGLAMTVAMIGSGSLEPELRRLVAELRLDCVHFPGFFNQSQLPRMYAASDVFVLPSENEPWGLAINEAMCAGLPIVTSREVGCVPDLVRDGYNGATFDAGSPRGLADALDPIVRNNELRRRMGEASRTVISGWSYAEGEAGLRLALRAVGLPVAAPAGRSQISGWGVHAC